MEEGTVETILKLCEKDSFDALECIHLIMLNYSNIGITHHLVQRLRLFHYLELEFFIPQLIQLLVSFETDSMALSEFIIDCASRYPHFCLITFWYLQSYMFELKDSPDSYSFHIVRSFINDIQNTMFNHEPVKHKDELSKFRENIHPALVLSGIVCSAYAHPSGIPYIKPIIVSQSKQRKSFLFKLANFHKSLTQNLTAKNRAISLELGIEPEERLTLQSRHSEESRPTTNSRTEDLLASYSDTELLGRDIKINTKIKSKKSLTIQKRKSEDGIVYHNQLLESDRRLVSHSLPDLNLDGNTEDLSITPVLSNASSSSLVSLNQLDNPLARQSITLRDDQKVKQLHVHYFKKETEFMMALQNISVRLSHVPKEARLTTLRAELAIINNTLLPSEIDIPQLLPISSQQNKKFHRILKLNVNEACVLNSAERVPFLLLIEFLSEDMDFDPNSEHNKSIIFSRVTGDKTPTSRRLDYSKASPSSLNEATHNLNDEEDLGDASIVSLSNEKHFIAHQFGSLKVDDFHEAIKATDSRKSRSSSPSLANTNHISTKDLSAQMRIAAVMLQQLEKSGQANSEQAASIKSRIVESMKALQDEFEHIDYKQISEINSVNIGQDMLDAGARKLENDFKLGEDWQTKKDRIRKASSFGHLKNWELCSVIAKNGDDIPQEAFACQLISMISKIWRTNSVGVWTKNMKILVTSANSGLVETINNAMSIHSIKKSLTEMSVKNGENLKGTVVSIKDYFIKVYGDENSARYRKAQDCFARSLAAYSIICYILQIKDRHNGNIMLDNEGHIIHIDFGFLLSNSPGSVGFEAAPFKLTQEYVDILGGFDSTGYNKFKILCKECFLVLRRNYEPLINIVDLMLKDSSLPCFKNGTHTSVLLKQRLQLDLSEEECKSFVETTLIGKSIGSLYTRFYDQFQLLTQGIYV